MTRAVIAHERVEDRLFVPLVRRHLELEPALSRTVLLQEQAIKRDIQRLHNADDNEREWGESLARTSRMLRMHFVFEERQVWTLLREELAPATLDDIGQAMAVAHRQLVKDRWSVQRFVRPRWLENQAGRYFGAAGHFAGTRHGPRPTTSA